MIPSHSPTKHGVEWIGAVVHEGRSPQLLLKFTKRSSPKFSRPFDFLPVTTSLTGPLLDQWPALIGIFIGVIVLFNLFRAKIFIANAAFPPEDSLMESRNIF